MFPNFTDRFCDFLLPYCFAVFVFCQLCGILRIENEIFGASSAADRKSIGPALGQPWMCWCRWGCPEGAIHILVAFTKFYGKLAAKLGNLYVGFKKLMARQLSDKGNVLFILYIQRFFSQLVAHQEKKNRTPLVGVTSPHVCVKLFVSIVDLSWRLLTDPQDALPRLIPERPSYNPIGVLTYFFVKQA